MIRVPVAVPGREYEVVVGAGEIGMSGRIDEHVSLDKLVTSRAIFRRVAERMLGC